jgi:Leucine-rich repeat (LRR) protein
MRGNVIESMGGLSALHNLQVLDLSCNRIERVEHIDQLPQLHTLLVAENLLRSSEDVGALPAPNSGEKVANRDTKGWHGAKGNGP